MEDLTRRRLLQVGAGTGAALLAAPTFGWTAGTAEAKPGDGPRIDAKESWDDEPDQLIADIYNSRHVTQTNNGLRKWRKNGQALSKEIPADLRAFIEKARELPEWADPKKLDDAVHFNQKRGTYLGVLYGFASGMMSTVIPHEAMVVYYSRGGANMKDRISKTAKLGYDIGSLNAYQDNGEMSVTCVKTRLIHSAVRHLLPQQHKWSSRMPYQKMPITQADQMVTWHSLPTTVMRMLKRWQVPINAAESEGFLHSWQVAGHMLGINDGLIPATWKDAEAQAKIALDPVIKGTPEGRKLANILLDLGFNLDLTILSRGVLGALTRFMLGDKIANELRILREPVWDPLLETAWPPFILVREGLLQVGMPKEAYWTFDEILRQFVLLYISELRMPISIELPYTNNPHYK